MKTRHPKTLMWTAVGLLGLSVLGLIVGVLFKLFSPVMILDIVALWPLFLIPAGMAVFAYFQKTPKSWTVATLTCVSILILSVGFHQSGWRALPSAQARVTGVAIGEFAQVTLKAELANSKLIVGSGTTGASYRAVPFRNGGGAGAVRAYERIEGPALEVILTERTDSSWFHFGGWSIELSPDPIWSLDLSADNLDVDLSSMSVYQLKLDGEGDLKLAVGSNSVLDISGTWTVTVPPDASIDVVGDAMVPFEWELTDVGTTTPWAGPGWTINVADGSSVRIIEANA